MGVCAALRERGFTVQPYKKGPDYIDSTWHGHAAQRPCHNLDFNVQSRDEIRRHFCSISEQSDISIIEGNMGLFDSLDVDGSRSNAELAALLELPVILIINVEGATRSIVPLIQGFIAFDSKIDIGGLILNNIASQRHEERLREVIGHYIDIPIVGAIHRDRLLGIDERHLGLIPTIESREVDEKIAAIAQAVGRQVDLELLMKIAKTAPTVKTDPVKLVPPRLPTLKIGIARDAAFGFYYPDDLQTFIAQGAELIPFSPLNDSQLPADLDGLFIGGGFPETHLQQLSANVTMRDSIAEAIGSGLPCYAECGGLIYLSQSIEWQDERAQMVGVVPANCRVDKRPIGYGYAQLETTQDHPWPFTPVGAQFSAHEFHYSNLGDLSGDSRFGYRMIRGSGIAHHYDGFIINNLLASYIHLRSTGATPWIAQFLKFVAQKCDKRL